MLLEAVIVAAVFGGAIESNAGAAGAAVNPRDYGPCGPVALYCASRFLGRDATLARVKELAGRPDTQNRHSFAQLADAASALGLHTTALKMRAAEVRSAPLPAIAHMRYSHTQHREHFVTVVDCSDEGVLILDPPHLPVRITWESFADAFAGHLLCVRADAGGEPAIVGGRHFTAAERGAAGWLALCDIAISLWWVAHLGARTRARHADAWGVAAARYLPRILAGASFALALLAGTRATALALAGRAVLFTDATVELGALPIGRHQHNLALRNDGDATLLVHGVRPGCGCTTADWPDRIEPGATKTVALDIDVSPGTAHSTVTILSNDPQSPRLIDLYWVGPRQPSLQPAAIVADAAPMGKPFHRRTAVRYLGYEGMTWHPAVQLLTTGDDKSRLHVSAVGEPCLVVSGSAGVNTAQRIYEIILEVSVDAPPTPERVDVLAHLAIRYGSQDYKLRLPVSVKFERMEAAD